MNIELLYLSTDFSHVKNFFQNILLKLCDVQLQNYGAINFVPFFGAPCICFWSQQWLKF